MQNLEMIINQNNVATAIRYLLNLDFNALNEKTIKLGISNIVDIEQAKKLWYTVLVKDKPSEEKPENLVQPTLALAQGLNEDAKKNLIEYLTIQQIY